MRQHYCHHRRLAGNGNAIISRTWTEPEAYGAENICSELSVFTYPPRQLFTSCTPKHRVVITRSKANMWQRRYRYSIETYTSFPLYVVRVRQLLQRSRVSYHDISWPSCRIFEHLWYELSASHTVNLQDNTHFHASVLRWRNSGSVYLLPTGVPNEWEALWTCHWNCVRNS
jgi:hypothetical protein